MCSTAVVYTVDAADLSKLFNGPFHLDRSSTTSIESQKASHKEEKNPRPRKREMPLLPILVSLVFSVTLLTCAETVLDTEIDWSDVKGSANLDIFDNQEADNLFSDTNPDSLKWDSNISLDGSSTPISFLAEASVNNDDDIVAGGVGGGGCLSSSLQNTLAIGGIQARSPEQCVNPLDNSDSGPTTTTTTTNSPDKKSMNFFENGFPGNGVRPDPDICPWQHYQYRQLPLCDSGSHDDVEQDNVLWTISLKHARPCMYCFLIAVWCFQPSLLASVVWERFYLIGQGFVFLRCVCIVRSEREVFLLVSVGFYFAHCYSKCSCHRTTSR